MKTKWILSFASAALVLLFGLTFFFFGDVRSLSIINVGVVMAIVLGLKYHRMKRRPALDERNIKVARAAIGYSWFFSYLAVAILILLDYMDLFRLSAIHALSIVLFMMASVQMISYFILDRKGDIS
ncbi:hypothetical protein COT47_00930 [Candidatus Woesearchaeota archaeon CG08_land_8_20_14_0_20_43_7]|nr:MAG: hypothetical protein COT47_00930 [Candidatus Woesearchaeota archaeon CG08_land_8_20_14_0_20_43_7]